MIYLVKYDRVTSTTLEIRGFESAEQASKEKLQVELEMLKSGAKYEVVVLEAADEAALRRTHGRYFSTTGPVVVGEQYSESAQNVRHWFIRAQGGAWIIEFDGHRASYPSKELAVAAAAKDARAWVRSSGREAALRVVEANGTWRDFDVTN